PCRSHSPRAAPADRGTRTTAAESRPARVEAVPGPPARPPAPTPHARRFSSGAYFAPVGRKATSQTKCLTTVLIFAPARSSFRLEGKLVAEPRHARNSPPLSRGLCTRPGPRGAVLPLRLATAPVPTGARH